MLFVKDLKDGMQVNEIYLCTKKTEGTTKTGNPFFSVVLRDKTGEIDGKIWEPNSPGIAEFFEGDFLMIRGEVKVYQQKNQLTVRSVQKASESDYHPDDYFPCSKRDVNQMFEELTALIHSMKSNHFRTLLTNIFLKDEDFQKSFCKHSAAKKVHHAYIGGLLEHTLSVANICDFFSVNYPMLDRDLLVSSAILHDIGKTRELSTYPQNDYTDEGQLLGHIMIGAQMVQEALKELPDFPKVKADELLHCILAHHGQLEFGSPKKPEILEAMALSHADNLDAKLETMKESLANTKSGDLNWQNYNRFLESTLRRTSDALEE